MRFRLGVLQLAVGAEKAVNLRNAVARIAEAAGNGAQVVVLPECFTCPYGNKYFPQYAEPADGETSAALRQAAIDNKVVVIGGSFPERDGDRLYNTCMVYGPDGELLGKHRKVHLFDIDVPGKITFRESDTLSAGSQLTVVRTAFGNIGVGICYDMRFAEMAMLYATKHDCVLLAYPGAFNMTTGPLHWELLQRARATDNQLFVVSASPARDTSADYVAWAHSSIVDPWGRVIASAAENAEVVVADIDLALVDEVRRAIPVRAQKRHDLYRLVDSSSS